MKTRLLIAVKTGSAKADDCKKLIKELKRMGCRVAFLPMVGDPETDIRVQFLPEPSSRPKALAIK